MTNSKLEPLARAIELAAASRGLSSSRNIDGNVVVELPGNRRIAVRDRGSSAFRGEGVTVMVSRAGDGLFVQSQALSAERFDLHASQSSRHWCPEGTSEPTWSDEQLADQLLDRATS